MHKFVGSTAITRIVIVKIFFWMQENGWNSASRPWNCHALHRYLRTANNWAATRKLNPIKPMIGVLAFDPLQRFSSQKKRSMDDPGFSPSLNLSSFRAHARVSPYSKWTPEILHFKKPKCRNFQFLHQFIINSHQFSSILINYHQFSSILINLSSIVVNLSLITINSHQLYVIWWINSNCFEFCEHIIRILSKLVPLYNWDCKCTIEIPGRVNAEDYRLLRQFYPVPYPILVWWSRTILLPAYKVACTFLVRSRCRTRTTAGRVPCMHSTEEGLSLIK